jgi:hypothetical protein
LKLLKGCSNEQPFFIESFFDFLILSIVCGQTYKKTLPYCDKMHERLKGSYAKKIKKLRQSTVEPLYGCADQFSGDETGEHKSTLFA